MAGEIVLDEFSFLVSETDERGIITFANEDFCKIAGYSLEDLIGKPHNIVRHPDMPKIAFKGLWDDVQTKGFWTGIVKNLRKDGKYYWVYSHISPIFSEGEITGYTAARRPASENEILEIIPVYKALLEKEN